MVDRKAANQWRLVVALAFTPAAGGAQFTGAAHTCTWDRTPQQGAVVELRASSRLPCRLELREVGPTLRTSDTSQAFGFGPSVARRSDGRFFTAWQDRVSEWGPDGRLLRTWGRRGQGPGEFSPGLKVLHVAAQDRLVVREGQRLHWFDREGAHIQTLTFDRIAFDDEASVFLADGRLIASERVDDDNTIHVLNAALGNGPTGRVRSFASLRPEESSVAGSAQRALARAGADRVWAGPPWLTRRGYELELWDANGRLLQTLRRSVPWFPAGGRPTSNRSDRPPPGITKIHVDDRGLLYVFAVVVGAGWAPDKSPANFATVNVEVIDPLAGLLLATSGPITYAEALQRFPSSYFDGMNVGYQASTDAND